MDAQCTLADFQAISRINFTDWVAYLAVRYADGPNGWSYEYFLDYVSVRWISISTACFGYTWDEEEYANACNTICRADQYSSVCRTCWASAAVGAFSTVSVYPTSANCTQANVNSFRSLNVTILNSCASGVSPNMSTCFSSALKITKGTCTDCFASQLAILSASCNAVCAIRNRDTQPCHFCAQYAGMIAVAQCAYPDCSLTNTCSYATCSPTDLTAIGQISLGVFSSCLRVAGSTSSTAITACINAQTPVSSTCVSSLISSSSSTASSCSAMCSTSTPLTGKCLACYVSKTGIKLSSLYNDLPGVCHDNRAYWTVDSSKIPAACANVTSGVAAGYCAAMTMPRAAPPCAGCVSGYTSTSYDQCSSFCATLTPEQSAYCTACIAQAAVSGFGYCSSTLRGVPATNATCTARDLMSLGMTDFSSSIPCVDTLSASDPARLASCLSAHMNVWGSVSPTCVNGLVLSMASYAPGFCIAACSASLSSNKCIACVVSQTGIPQLAPQAYYAFTGTKCKSSELDNLIKAGLIAASTNDCYTANSLVTCVTNYKGANTVGCTNGIGSFLTSAQSAIVNTGPATGCTSFGSTDSDAMTKCLTLVSLVGPLTLASTGAAGATGYTGLIISTCYQDGSLIIPTTIAISYTAGGRFTLHPDSSTTGLDYCRITVTKWNGDIPNTESSYLQGDCTTLLRSPLTRSRASFSPIESPIQYGTMFSVILTRYWDDRYNIPTCTSAPQTIVPALCLGGNYTPTTVSAVLRPYGYINAITSNRPPTGDCVYCMTKSAVSALVSPAVSDCSPYGFPAAPISTGTEYAVQMINFATLADKDNDQPICGVNPAAITPTPCGTLLITDTGYGVITVVPFSVGVGRVCSYTLTTWNGISRTSIGLTKVSQDCSAVTFSYQEAGIPFEFGGHSYAFEYAEYPSGTSNVATTSPFCTNTASTPFATPGCLASSMSYGRPDPNSVSITTGIHKAYGVCKVRLTSVNGAPTYVTRVGACTETFYFTEEGSTNVLFGDMGHATFELSYYANGDSTSFPTCTSPTVLSIPSIAAYSCSGIQLALYEKVGSYAFSISTPFLPVVGKCDLILVRCAIDTSVNAKTIASFPHCRSTVTVGYGDISTVATSLAPGDICGFTWKYTAPGGSTCVSDQTLPGVHMYLPLTLSQGSFSSSQINVVFPGVPSALSLYTACTITTLDCDGVARNNNNPVACTGGTLPVTIPAGSNCKFSIKAFATGTTDSTYYGGMSAIYSFAAATVPTWAASQEVVVTLYGEYCALISWFPPTTAGGAAVLCYQVDRRDSTGTFYTIQTCAQDTDVSDTSMLTCGFTQGVPYTFGVIAMNHIGSSAALTSDPMYLELMQAAPDSLYDFPSSTQTSFEAHSFPVVRVSEVNPTTLPGGRSSTTDFRLFVGVLVSRCKLDSTNQVLVPLTITDPSYAAVLPLEPNSPPAFTRVFEPVSGSLGKYDMSITSQPAAGAYSLVTYSLETGGLLGMYSANPFFSGTAFSRKDPIIDFHWGAGVIINTTTTRVYDLVSIRWTGFIEAAYTETYTFTITSGDYVRLWIDNVIVINKWDDDDPCGGSCSGTHGLEQSDLSATATRTFSSIRLDYYHTKGPSQGALAYISLSWASFSQAMEVIPSTSLFKALPIQSTVRNLDVIPAVLNAGASVAVVPATATAGVPFIVNITAKDVYGNVLQSSDSSFMLSASGPSPLSASSLAVTPSANNGLYYIPVTLTLAGTYTVTITEVGFDESVSPVNSQVVVSANVPKTITSLRLSGSAIAGATSRFSFTVGDELTNSLACTQSAIAQIQFRASWTEDTLTSARLPVDDVAVRTERYGTVFTTATIGCNMNVYNATIALPLAGTYTVQVGVSGGSAATLAVTVAASATSSGINAVIVTSPWPPTSMQVGTATTFSVQLRDSNMNAIGTRINTDAVKVRLQNTDPATCTENESIFGLYDCTIIPTASGTNLALSVQTGTGTLASYLYTVNGVPTDSVGPWAVNVAAGSASASKSVILGLRPMISAGVPMEVTLILKDEQNNILGPLADYPMITVTLDELPMGTSFVYNADGSITIPLIFTTAPAYPILKVYVGGSRITLPYGIETITVYQGSVSGTMSTCSTWASLNSLAAGVPGSVTCTIKDSQSNPVSATGLYVYSNFRHQTDLDLAPITATGVISDSEGTYLVTTSSLIESGVYDVYTLISQPGGLLAQYYSESTFSTIISIDQNPLTENRHVTDPPIDYTQIDPFVDITTNGPILVNGVTANSIRWIGMIRGPADGNVQFAISATGGVQATVGTGTPQVDMLGATSVYSTFTVSMTKDSYYSVTMSYVPANPAAISLKWLYTDAPYHADFFVVPPTYLYSMINNYVSAFDTVTVTVAAVSTTSTLSFASTYVVDELNYIIVQARDIYGNAFTTSPACLYTEGTLPECLFSAYLLEDDGSTTFGTAEDLMDGTIKLPVTFATSGPKVVHVRLQIDNIPTYSELSDQGYSITVENP